MARGMEAGRSRVSGSADAFDAPVVPKGREARLWRAVVELFEIVDEAAERARPLASGRLEHLVVEFDDAYTAFVEGMERLPSEPQLVALQAVDRHLAAMVRAQDAALWTAAALVGDARWDEARRLALVVLRAHAWPERKLALVVAGGDA